MAQDKTQFLHFNAYSIKEMIIRKLSEDTNFTDQVYEGSNLNILIDLVAYMYQCLMYNLNNAAAESMFADTRLYENMRRLVKFIGYNPKGIIPSVGAFYLDNRNKNGENGLYADKYIQKYSYINTGQIDRNGNPICFSTIRDIHIDRTGTNAFFKFPMYNGRWIMHHVVFTSSGDDYMSFVLDNVGSDISSTIDSMHVANNCIDVYVEHDEYQTNGKVNTTLTQFQQVDFELFAHNRYDVENNVSFAQIYTRNNNIVNIQLNEKKVYELKFGNGIIGAKPAKGDRIYVFYLQTNGEDGQIDIEGYGDKKTLIHNSDVFGLTEDMYNAIFQNATNSVPDVDIYLDSMTTDIVKEEEADEIRIAAPEWFKLGQRLVTSQDYEYYIKNMYKGEVIGVCVENNMEYAAKFYKWLYMLGKMNHGNGSYYINERKLTQHNLAFADPADANNVYVWIKIANGISIDVLKDEYNYELQRIKTLTQNVIFMDAINVNFTITAMPQDVLVNMLESESYTTNTDSYIEITMDNDIIYASNIIAEQINSIVVDFFKSDEIQIGQTVDFNKLTKRIFQINGVKKIRTVYIPMKEDGTTKDYQNAVVYDGLSFASWSSNLIDIGDDLQISTGNRTLQEFQYPVLFDTNIVQRVKVIKPSLNTGLYMQI